ncbi:hypothetical protein VM57_17110 [Stenotrophomonas maltophilia]|uniref:Uncharacterized protein n=1 Tax=Stenotrophomonas maltophilia TaxID=40324 RepID=A0A0F5ZMH5_STEMA|nr:hypothetical protein VM57_17110 [Stenotrophomonas maltophilia]
MSVRVLLDTRRNVLKVERGPFVEQGNGMAYVMDGRTAVRRPVELGVSSLGEVESSRVCSRATASWSPAATCSRTPNASPSTDT